MLCTFAIACIIKCYGLLINEIHVSNINANAFFVEEYRHTATFGPSVASINVKGNN